MSACNHSAIALAKSSRGFWKCGKFIAQQMPKNVTCLLIISVFPAFPIRMFPCQCYRSNKFSFEINSLPSSPPAIPAITPLPYFNSCASPPFATHTFLLRGDTATKTGDTCLEGARSEMRVALLHYFLWSISLSPRECSYFFTPRAEI